MLENCITFFEHAYLRCWCAFRPLALGEFQGHLSSPKPRFSNLRFLHVFSLSRCIASSGSMPKLASFRKGGAYDRPWWTSMDIHGHLGENDFLGISTGQQNRRSVYSGLENGSRCNTVKRCKKIGSPPKTTFKCVHKTSQNTFKTIRPPRKA